MSTSASFLLPEVVAETSAVDIALVEDGTGTLRWHDLAADQELFLTAFGGATVTPTLLRKDCYGRANARANLYIAHDNGVMKYEGGSGFVEAGLMPGARIVLDTDPSVLTEVPPGDEPDAVALGPSAHVAYRVVCVRKDRNGVEVRSRPSGAVDVVNFWPLMARVNLTIHAPYRAHFDKVEIYRSNEAPPTATLDEEMQLVGALDVSAFDEDGVAVFQDNVAASARGATLYTSPSREGIEGSNDRPPACAVMARFKSCVFFGNTVGPRRFIANYNQPKSDSVDVSFTMDSNILTLTNPAQAAKFGNTIRPGMILTKVIGEATNDEYRTPGTWIAYTLANKIYLNNPMHLDGSDLNVHFAPSVRLDQTWHELTKLESDLFDPENDNFARFVAYPLTPPKSGYQKTLVIESFEQRESFNPPLRASHGEAFDPPIPNFPTHVDFDQDVTPGVIRWSKPDEPEHVPQSNYAFVGDQARPIVALAVTRDSLFIFKDDGLFRLTGVNGTWTIEPFEPTLRCVLPSSVQEVGGEIFALTSRGLARITDTDVQIVSLTIHNILRPILGYLADQTGPKQLGVWGHKGGANERDNEYLLLLDNTDSPLTTWKGALVYNANTKSFTTWSWSPLGTLEILPASFGVSTRGQLVLGTSSGATYGFPRLYEATAAEPELHQNDPLCPFVTDGRSELLTLTRAGSDDTYIYDDGFLAADGDVVLHAATGRLYPVTLASVHSVRLDITRSVPALTDGGFQGYILRPLTCTVEPRPFWEPDQRTKLWFHVTSQFSRFIGPLWLRETFTASNEVGTEIATQTQETLRRVEAFDFAYQRLGTFFRQLVPRNHARSWHLIIRVSWQMVLGGVKLEGLFAESRPHGEHRPAPEGPA